MNEELMKNLKSLKTPEKLGALLKAAGAEELSGEQLKELFGKLSSGSLSDKDLEGAAGGIASILEQMLNGADAIQESSSFTSRKMMEQDSSRYQEDGRSTHYKGTPWLNT